MSSRNHPDPYDSGESCSVTMIKDAFVNVGSIFDLGALDSLVIAGKHIHIQESVPLLLDTGDTITWTAQSSDNSKGWQFCFSGISFSGKSLQFKHDWDFFI